MISVSCVGRSRPNCTHWTLGVASCKIRAYRQSTDRYYIVHSATLMVEARAATATKRVSMICSSAMRSPSPVIVFCGRSKSKCKILPHCTWHYLDGWNLQVAHRTATSQSLAKKKIWSVAFCAEDERVWLWIDYWFRRNKLRRESLKQLVRAPSQQVCTTLVSTQRISRISFHLKHAEINLNLTNWIIYIILWDRCSVTWIEGRERKYGCLTFEWCS